MMMFVCYVSFRLSRDHLFYNGNFTIEIIIIVLNSCCNSKFCFPTVDYVESHWLHLICERASACKVTHHA